MLRTMRLQLFIFCILFPLSLSSFAQEKADSPYHFSKDILEGSAPEDEMERQLKYNEQMMQFAMIGEFEQALIAGDSLSIFEAPVSEAAADSFFNNFEAYEAVDVILEEAANSSAVFINEAHHIPMHRAFTYSLLRGLYDQGYRYFGIEALSHEDTLLNERGYPIKSSGYLVQEPMMNELIREAIWLGFTVFPYENNHDSLHREEGQARNIYEQIKDDPDAKVLVHAGYDHISEDDKWEIAGSIPMAVHFKKLTGIDPLTIDQTRMYERSHSSFENGYYGMIGYPRTPQLFLNEEGQVFVNPSDNKHYDIQVFHPRTRYVEERPDWQMLGGHKQLVPLKKLRIKPGLPVLIKVYYEGEDLETAIPTDILEVRDNEQPLFLLLDKGKYWMVIENSRGVVQEEDLKVK